jgi:glycosyltransferase involved in cell wall biosynthesis
LNECIDRARGLYLARMDADDVAYPDRLARQLAFLVDHAEVDLCSAGAMVFGKGGRPLWRFRPAGEHARITRSPFRGFPLWHPVWMGRIEWFRRWRYEESAWLAQDQELLLRSYRSSRFANLPQVLLGYRRERASLKKLLRYKLLLIKYVCDQPDGGPRRLAEDAAVDGIGGEVCGELRRPARWFRTADGTSGRRSALRSGDRGVAQPLDPSLNLVWGAEQRDLPPFVPAAT